MAYHRSRHWLLWSVECAMSSCTVQWLRLRTVCRHAKYWFRVSVNLRLLRSFFARTLLKASILFVSDWQLANTKVSKNDSTYLWNYIDVLITMSSLQLPAFGTRRRSVMKSRTKQGTLPSTSAPPSTSNSRTFGSQWRTTRAQLSRNCWAYAQAATTHTSGRKLCQFRLQQGAPWLRTISVGTVGTSWLWQL